MNKKILVIKGSPRRDGFTNRLWEKASKGFIGDEIVTFDTYKEDFKPCFGCNYCTENGMCFMRDLDAFFKDFETADVIIFLSPIYNGGFPAPLKALIDRFQVYFNRFYACGKKQPIKKERKAYFIAACGRKDTKAFQYMEYQLKRAFTILNIKLQKSFLCSDTDTVSTFNEAIEEIKKEVK